MEKLGLNTLREMFLSYFEKQGHYRRESFSLIPEDDPSLLLIGAGIHRCLGGDDPDDEAAQLSDYVDE